jgi:hypothetical protein
MEETNAVAVTEPVGLDDENVIIFGAVPAAATLLLALVIGVIYTIRKRKSWRELSESMRLDDVVDDPNASLKTGDLADMDPTRPSQRLSELSRDD